VTNDIAVHLLPPPALRSALSFIHAPIGEQRIEELD
jgi:hypothetical protein